MSKKHLAYGGLILLLVLLYVARFAGFGLDGLATADLPTNARVEKEKATVQELQVKLSELYKKQAERTDFRLELVDRATPLWRVTGTELPTVDIQDRVQRLALKANVKLTKINTPRIVKIGEELRAIEVQISSVTSIKAFSEFASFVENHSPMLAWDQCNIRPNKTKDPDSIMVQGRIRAYVLEPGARAYLRGETVAVSEGELEK